MLSVENGAPYKLERNLYTFERMHIFKLQRTQAEDALIRLNEFGGKHCARQALLRAIFSYFSTIIGWGGVLYERVQFSFDAALSSALI